MFFWSNKKILSQKALRSWELERFLDFLAKNRHFGLTKHPSENEIFSPIFKIVFLRVAERFLIQIFFVGLTNISTCRKHDFWTGGRFFRVPTEAFSPGHISADPLDLAKIEKNSNLFFAGCENLRRGCFMILDLLRVFSNQNTWFFFAILGVWGGAHCPICERNSPKDFGWKTL